MKENVQDLTLQTLSDRLAKADIYQSMSFSIADALIAANTREEAVQRCLRIFAHSLNMQLAIFWLKESEEYLSVKNVWQHPLIDLTDFIEASKNTRFSLTESVPGKVLANKESVWISNFDEKNLLRSEAAAKSRISTDIAFPIYSDMEIIGVIELFSLTDTEQPDSNLLDVLVNLGYRIGAYFKFKKLEREYNELRTRFRLLAESATAAVIVADTHGQIVLWGGKAAEFFGWLQHEIIGKSILTIMPERFHVQHIAMFEKINKKDNIYGEKVIRTIDNISGLKKDGTEFPMEITLSTWNTTGDRYYGAVIRKKG